MFERYDEQARRVLFFARYEASQLGSVSIETEHLLLGLLREPNGLAARVLGGLPLVEIRRDIEAAAAGREKIATSVEIPFSAGTKRSLHLAVEEADRLGDRHIGPEHLLLGLLREEASVAALTLGTHGLRLESARQRIVELGTRPPSGPSSTATTGDARGQLEHIMDLVQRLGMTVSGDPETAMRIAMLLEDVRGLKARFDRRP